jgi:hypothetical protein
VTPGGEGARVEGSGDGPSSSSFLSRESTGGEEGSTGSEAEAGGPLSPPPLAVAADSQAVSV